jgi:hypothetical protein
MTRFGGLVLFRQFCKSLDLRHFLQLYVRWPNYSHRSYHPADLFLAHVFAIVAGIGRIENTPKVLLTTVCFRPFLVYRLSSSRHFTDLPLALRQKELTKPTIRSRQTEDGTFPASESSLQRYCRCRYHNAYNQEGVAVGYIPKRRHGQPSYAPIISSEGRRGLSLGMDLRAGNVHASKEAWAFLQSILNKLPSSIASSRTRVRLDGAFYNKEIIEPLDQERLGYVVVAKMTRPLRKKMVAARYEPFARGWEAAEFTYTPFHRNENTGSLRYEGPWLWRPTKFSSVCSPSGATRTTGCW